MSRSTAKAAAVVPVVAVLAILTTRLASRAESKPAHRPAGINSSETTETKIERAMSAV